MSGAFERPPAELGLADSMSRLLAAHTSDEVIDTRRLVAVAAADGWFDLMAVALGPDAEFGLAEALRVGEVWGQAGAPLELIVNGAFVAPLATYLPSSDFASMLADRVAAGATVAVPVPRDSESAMPLGPATCDVRTTGDGPRLSGRASGLTSGEADVFLVMAEDNGVEHLAMVRADDAGTRVEQVDTVAPGLSVAAVELEDASPVSVLRLSTEVRRALRDSTAVWLIALNAVSVGICQEMVRRTVEFTSERKQFGQAIATFQAVRHMVADMVIATESGRCLAEHSSHAWARSAPGAADELAAARLYLADRAVEVCEGAIQLHGGAGFTWELGLHHHYRRALLAQTFLTDADGIRERLAKAIVAEPVVPIEAVAR